MSSEVDQMNAHLARTRPAWVCFASHLQSAAQPTVRDRLVSTSGHDDAPAWRAAPLPALPRSGWRPADLHAAFPAREAAMRTLARPQPVTASRAGALCIRSARSATAHVRNTGMSVTLHGQPLGVSLQLRNVRFDNFCAGVTRAHESKLGNRGKIPAVKDFCAVSKSSLEQ